MFSKKKNIVTKKNILISKYQNSSNETSTQALVQENPKNIKSSKANNITIAICSTHKGAGCTHISLLTAYEISKEHKTALVELDPGDCLRQYESTYQLKQGPGTSKKLSNLDVYFYGDTTLLDIYREGYEYIIFDIGCILNNNNNQDINNINHMRGAIEEAYKASKRVLVTQVKDWQQKYLAKFIELENIEGWQLFTNLTNEKDFKELNKIFSKKNINVQLYNVPYVSDVFETNSNKKKIIEQLLY